ncbi:hypothetical protein chiPu_0030564, partial [Chiloscyllium punctatum]|nr:hypothetical protein [Chiloscyllium punctatum]
PPPRVPPGRQGALQYPPPESSRETGGAAGFGRSGSDVRARLRCVRGPAERGGRDVETRPSGAENDVDAQPRAGAEVTSRPAQAGRKMTSWRGQEGRK